MRRGVSCRAPEAAYLTMILYYYDAAAQRKVPRLIKNEDNLTILRAVARKIVRKGLFARWHCREDVV